jgi:hypothetical protein
MLNLTERNIISVKGAGHTQYFLCLLMFLFCSAKAFSQSGATEIVAAKQEEKRPAYINIAAGLNISNFRDFATSPLRYSGTPLYTSLAHIDVDQKRESHFTLSYSFGNYKTNFNQHASESRVNTISLNYLELFELKKLSSSKLNIKIGGQFSSTVNHRENPGLFNNGNGADIISTLFGSAKATLDLSRTEDKIKKFLFIKYKVQKRKRSLSYTMNVGMVNSSYRNGFAYTNPSAPLNEDDFFAGYEFRVFKGFRLNSALDYTIYLHNENAVQFSYIFDAYRTGGHHDNFEMSAHVLKLSLLFALK